jgi:hypothetical protein
MSTVVQCICRLSKPAALLEFYAFFHQSFPILASSDSDMQAFGARSISWSQMEKDWDCGPFYYLILSARALRKWMSIFLIIFSIKVYFKSETQEDGDYPCFLLTIIYTRMWTRVKPWWWSDPGKAVSETTNRWIESLNRQRESVATLVFWFESRNRR